MATARDIIDAAHREIGVLAQEGQSLSGAQASQALTRLNRFLDRLATERLAIYTVTRTSGLTITASTASYTVGSGATWSLTRPVFVERIGYVDTSTDPDTEEPLHRFTEQEWANVSQKARTSTRPDSYYYNPTFPNATVDLYPVPTSTTLEAVIYHWEAVSQFAALTTTVSLPPAWEEMLVTNLAVLLCPSYERQPHPVLLDTARKSLGTLKRSNIRERQMEFEASLSFPAWDHDQYGRYDIYKG